VRPVAVGEAPAARLTFCKKPLRFDTNHEFVYHVYIAQQPRLYVCHIHPTTKVCFYAKKQKFEVGVVLTNTPHPFLRTPPPTTLPPPNTPTPPHASKPNLTPRPRRPLSHLFLLPTATPPVSAASPSSPTPSPSSRDSLTDPTVRSRELISAAPELKGGLDSPCQRPPQSGGAPAPSGAGCRQSSSELWESPGEVGPQRFGGGGSSTGPWRISSAP
jgi:hypothetical protein